MTNSNKPLRIDKIMISPKRFIYVKLWGPSHHAHWGMTRSLIELQDAKISEDKHMSYHKPIRLPCDGSAALIANLISNYIIEGRQLNNRFKIQQTNASDIKELPEEEIHSSIELENLLLNEFSNEKLSKTRILTKMTDRGLEIDKETLVHVLESLANQKKITKESAVHTSSGTNYFLWGFP